MREGVSMKLIHKWLLVALITLGTGLFGMTFALFAVASPEIPSLGPTLGSRFAGFMAPIAPEQPQEDASALDIVVGAHTGFITGTLYAVGGPVRPSRKKLLGASHFPVVVTRGARVVARATTTEQGKFRVAVRPGAYSIAGELHAMGGLRACSAKRVVVRAGKKTPTMLFCSIR
jgi:hypothetical protein